jgi:hypothetical protein
MYIYVLIINVCCLVHCAQEVNEIVTNNLMDTYQLPELKRLMKKPEKLKDITAEPEKEKKENKLDGPLSPHMSVQGEPLSFEQARLLVKARKLLL